MKVITIYLFTIIFFSLTTFAQSNNTSISKIEKRVLKINQDSTLKSFKVPESEIIKVKSLKLNINIFMEALALTNL